MIEADRYAERVAVFDTPGGHPITMHYRDRTNDFNTLNATLVDDEYQLPRMQTGHALDVGGYLGSVGIALALDNPNYLVTIIEPVPVNVDLIVRNIADNGVGDQVSLIQGTVGVGTVRYGFSGDESANHHTFVGNSTISVGNPSGESVEYEPIPLAHLLPIDFLKIDCEGGEWAFLDDPLVAEVPLIMGEAHAIDGHRGSDIIALLHETHDVTLIGGSPDGTCGFRAVLR